MRSEGPVVAILCSDLHLSDKPPAARVGEACWFEAMERSLSQLRAYEKRYEVPVIVAGDLFDRWNPSSRLVNFAFKSLPQVVFAIPGQHDLRHHALDDLDATGYGTLAISGRITNVPYHVSLSTGSGVNLHAFPWGCDLCDLPQDAMSTGLNLAVVHRYVWSTTATSYTGASKADNVKSFMKQLKGYDAVVVGDNHKGFHLQHNKQTVFNCGGFMRRTSDQKSYVPQIGLLHADGQVSPIGLKLKDEVFAVTSIERNEAPDQIECGEVLEFLRSLDSDTSTDFVASLREYARHHKLSKAVVKLLRSFIQD